MTAPNFSGPTSVVALADASGNPATGANSIAVQGNAASGATDSGDPVKVGGVFNTTLPTLLTGQRGGLQMNSRGVTRVALWLGTGPNEVDASQPNNDTSNGSGFAIRSIAHQHSWDGTNNVRQRGDVVATSVLPGLSSTYWTYAPPTGGITSSTAGVTAKAAAGASVRNYIAGGMISWSTLIAATEFVIRDGAAGTILWRVTLPTVAGIIPLNFNVPLRGTANTLVEIAAISSVTGNIYCTLQGFTGA